MKDEIMRLHYIQHVPFEDLANMEVWARKKGHSISCTRLFNDEDLPGIDNFDWLIILGGPMNIYEEEKYPWLVREKRFISEIIAGNKVVLGICLGAQLIADVLGGRISRNKYTEIGWYPVTLTTDPAVFNGFPGNFIAFHWHRDTFEIPVGGVGFAESKGCSNQGFVYKDRVIGLQFHIEYSQKSIEQMLQNCGDEIVEGMYIQEQDEILAGANNLKETNRILNLFLNNMERKFQKMEG